MRARWLRVTAALALLPAGLALAGTSSGVAAGPPAAAPVATPTPTPLFTPDGVSRWAYPARRAEARTRPDVAAPTVAHLRLTTEDAFPEVYRLLGHVRAVTGREWVLLQVPGRPNGRTGWVPRDALGAFHVVDTWVQVDRARHRVSVRRGGRTVASFPVGVGKPSTPTPAGDFVIREKFVAGGGLYGPRALGTSAYAPHLTDWPHGGVVGFHGTNEPQLIPGSPSHGCIRLRNADVLRFYRLVPVGAPVRIR